jgi:hypothetical protein
VQELEAEQAAAEERKRHAAVQKKLKAPDTARAAVEEVETRELEQEKPQGLSARQLAYLRMKTKGATAEERKRHAQELEQIQKAAKAEEDRIAQEEQQRAAQVEERPAYEIWKAQQDQLALEAQKQVQKAKETTSFQLQDAIALQRKMQQQKLEAKQAAKLKQDRIACEERQHDVRGPAQDDEVVNEQAATERRKAQQMRDRLEGSNRQKQIDNVIAFSTREVLAQEAATTPEQKRIIASGDKAWKEKQQFFVFKELARKNHEQRRLHSEGSNGKFFRYWTWKSLEQEDKEQESAEQAALSKLGGLLARKHTDEEFAAAVTRAKEILGDAEVSDAESEL